MFRIEPNTGVIRLVSSNINLERDKYELNVTAMDDGKCCVENGKPSPDPKTIHTSTAVVVVFITDVNDNKPIFEDCGSYSPKIEEGAPNGSPVIKVHAVDRDKGVNGQLKYSIVQQPNQKGKIKQGSSVGDLNPFVFGPAGSGFVCMRYRYGSSSGSFYHQAKIVRKTFIPSCFVTSL